MWTINPVFFNHIYKTSIRFEFVKYLTCLYASHNMLDFLLLTIFSILLPASTASSGLFILFDVFSKSSLTISSIIIESFTFWKISSLVFLILFFVLLVSKSFNKKKKNVNAPVLGTNQTHDFFKNSCCCKDKTKPFLLTIKKWAYTKNILVNNVLLLSKKNKNIHYDASKKLYGHKTLYPSPSLKGFLYFYVKKIFYC